MARKRGQPKATDLKRLRDVFRSALKAVKERTPTPSLQATTNVVSGAALLALAAVYPDAAALGTIGLGTISSLWAQALAGRGKPDAATGLPPELIEKLLEHDQARQELAQFLEDYDFHSVVIDELGEKALNKFKDAVRETLVEHRVATKDDVESATSIIMDAINRLAEKIPPPTPDGLREGQQRLQAGQAQIIALPQQVLERAMPDGKGPQEGEDILIEGALGRINQGVSPGLESLPPTTAQETRVSVFSAPMRNPLFIGREEALENLRLSLEQGGAALLAQAVTGLGGVGKTQLAIEYANRHRDDYDVVWWVRSEEPAQLAEDFAALAKALDLPEKDEQYQRVVTQAVCHWLESNDGWLLVFDNVPHPKSLEGYRPGGGGGHVIITSRYPNWASMAKPLPVEVWPRNESVAFLGKQIGRTDEAAGELAEELGDLPLALEQAAAYIKAADTSLEDYLQLYGERRAALWPDEKPPLGYSHTVRTTWAMAMEHLQEKEPAAADLLNLIAFLAPDDIPRDLLANAIEDELVLNRAIAALRHYSLITTDDDSISIHRLVQTVTRDRLFDEQKAKSAAAAVQLMHAAFPFEDKDPATWSSSGRLLPHALAAAEHAADVGFAIDTAGHLLNEGGLCLSRRAEFAAARAAYEQALAIGERTHGFDHPRVAIRVNNLGNVLQEMGDLEGARKNYQRALAIFEKTYGEEHPQVATAANNLGNVLQGMGDLEGARKNYQRALAIDEKAYGPDHPSVAIRVNNLGGLLYRMGDLEGARAHFERALAIDENAYGPDHPDVATDVNNLGSVLQDMGDLEGAKAHYERALAIDEKTYGPDHPEVATDVNNLGGVLQAMGDLEGAKECYKRALEIRLKLLGEEHPNTQLVRRNLQALGKAEGS